MRKIMKKRTDRKAFKKYSGVNKRNLPARTLMRGGTRL